MNWTWTDLIMHVLIGYPLYQILGTTRHELSHALAAVVQGVGVREIRVLPSRIDGKWYWGFVRFGVGDLPHWWVHMMPYFVNIAHISIGLWIVRFVAGYGVPHVWFASMVLFLASPIVDILYNFGKWKFYDSGDFAAALR